MWVEGEGNNLTNIIVNLAYSNLFSILAGQKVERVRIFFES